MPVIDVRCLTPDCRYTFEYNRPLADYPRTRPCPICASSTEQYHPQPRRRWTLDPVIVFRGADGEYRFPGDPHGGMAYRYAAEGYERIELKTAADIRRFERQINRRDLSRSARRVEIMEEMRERREHATRSELYRQMQSFSQQGRDLAHAAMRRRDNKPRARAQESGFHVEAFSLDRSNREESRDPQGRRRRD